MSTICNISAIFVPNELATFFPQRSRLHSATIKSLSRVNYMSGAIKHYCANAVIRVRRKGAFEILLFAREIITSMGDKTSLCMCWMLAVATFIIVALAAALAVVLVIGRKVSSRRIPACKQSNSGRSIRSRPLLRQEPSGQDYQADIRQFRQRSHRWAFVKVRVEQFKQQACV